MIKHIKKSLLWHVKVTDVPGLDLGLVVQLNHLLEWVSVADFLITAKLKLEALFSQLIIL